MTTDNWDIPDSWWLMAALAPLLLVGTWLLWPQTPGNVTDWRSEAEITPQQDHTGTRVTPVEQPVQAASPETTDSDNFPTAEEAPLDLDRLQHVLANIAIDDRGQLQLDESALSPLQQAFRALETAGPGRLEELQQYIRAGLSGDAGRQAAALLGNYVAYRHALSTAQQQWQRQQETGPREQLEKTIALRRQHLSPLTASQLFAGEEAHQRYLLARETLLNNDQLDEAQRGAALSQLREELRSGVLLVSDQHTDVAQNLATRHSIWQSLGLGRETRGYLHQQTLSLVAAGELTGGHSGDWQSRYNRFERDRELILRAGLPEADKRQQIDELLSTHFTPDELHASRHWLPDHMMQGLAD